MEVAFLYAKGKRNAAIKSTYKNKKSTNFSQSFERKHYHVTANLLQRSADTT
jgi:hypothetical protein